MPNIIVHYSRTQPSRTILAVIVIVTFVAGLWLFTPFAITTLGGPAVSVGFNVSHALGATINCLFCVPALIGVYKNSPAKLARGSWWLFIWYSFVTLLRIILSPFGSLVFVPTLIIAMACSIIYLEQKFVSTHVLPSIEEVGEDR